jgi:phosphatidylglycerol:prolipoprotein diacylglycerol transferase
VVLKLPVLPPYTVGPLTFNTFGPLVAMGILFGIHLTRRWCQRFALEWHTMQVGVTWVLCGGFAMAHLMAIGESSPARLFNPQDLLAMRSEFSSFGGFLGSTLAALCFCKTRALAVRPTIDCLLYGFIGGWLFGRLGCFSVHDHPGEVTTLPTGVWVQGVLRHDLGFYELAYSVVLFTAITIAIRSRKRFDGFVIVVTATSYSLVRFCLDFLRIGDSTYAGLTLAQWGCIPLFVLGVYPLLSGVWNRYTEASR